MYTEKSIYTYFEMISIGKYISLRDCNKIEKGDVTFKNGHTSNSFIHLEDMHDSVSIWIVATSLIRD